MRLPIWILISWIPCNGAAWIRISKRYNPNCKVSALNLIVIGLTHLETDTHEISQRPLKQIHMKSKCNSYTNFNNIPVHRIAKLVQNFWKYSWGSIWNLNQVTFCKASIIIKCYGPLSKNVLKGKTFKHFMGLEHKICVND